MTSGGRTICWLDHIMCPNGDPYWILASAFYRGDMNTIMETYTNIRKDSVHVITYLFAMDAAATVGYSKCDDEKRYTILLRLLQMRKICAKSTILYKDYMSNDITLLSEACSQRIFSVVPLLLAFGAPLECGLQRKLPKLGSHIHIWRCLFEYGMDPTTSDDYAIMISGPMYLRYMRFLEKHDMAKDVYVPRMALHAWKNNEVELALLIIRAARNVPSLRICCQRVVWRHKIGYEGLIPEIVMTPQCDVQNEK